jgi:hypothetical protein
VEHDGSVSSESQTTGSCLTPTDPWQLALLEINQRSSFPCASLIDGIALACVCVVLFSLHVCVHCGSVRACRQQPGGVDRVASRPISMCSV